MDTSFNILYLSLFVILCVCWGGLIFTHYNFNVTKSEKNIWYAYELLFLSNYISMFVFFLTWIPIICGISHVRGLLLIPSIYVSLVIFCYSIYLQTVDITNLENTIYSKIILESCVIQFFIINLFTILAVKYENNIPVICVNRNYSQIE